MVQSEQCTIFGFFGAILFGIVIIVAGKIHWGIEAPICLVPAEVPFQDVITTQYNGSDYPNPRCASLISNGGRFGQDRTDRMHYFWQLPEETRDLVASQTTAWLFYAMHQLAVWSTIYVAQLEFSQQGSFQENGINKSAGPKYTSELRRINWISLGCNFFFWLLHLLHTHIWYDATAPTAHEMSSQGSVILMLIFVLMMEGPKRGLFFGRPAMTWSLSAIDVVKRYHGYAFSWAVIYTFWYHPMEGYLGHVFGFAHVWMVMFQGSMMYTTAHLNKYWRMICEAWVFLHGMVISMQTLSSNSWPMFTFGFGAIFAMTQVPGLPCLQDRHVVLRLLPTVIFAVVYVLVFVATPGWTKPQVFVFIPSAEYLGAIAMNYIFWVAFRCMNGSNPDEDGEKNTTATATMKETTTTTTTTTTTEKEYELPEVNASTSTVADKDVETNDTKSKSKRTGETQISASERYKWITATVMLYLVAIVCSVIAQVMELAGSGGGSLVVYVPMCICVPLSFLTLKKALPYSQKAVDAEEKDGRIPTKGKTTCCVHL